MYENSDSILIVPISEDAVGGMKLIGQDIQLDLVLDKKSTMFF
jgi:hypothetical protein